MLLLVLVLVVVLALTRDVVSVSGAQFWPQHWSNMGKKGSTADTLPAHVVVVLEQFKCPFRQQQTVHAKKKLWWRRRRQ